MLSLVTEYTCIPFATRGPKAQVRTRSVRNSRSASKRSALVQMKCEDIILNSPHHLESRCLELHPVSGLLEASLDILVDVCSSFYGL